MATAYGSGPVLLLCMVPMLIIANCYRRLNLWVANTGASFEWVGRSINPYLGFITGWFMVVGYIIGTVAEVVVLGPAVLAVFGSNTSNVWAFIAVDTALCLIMLIVAVVGIKITARTQIGMAAIEYIIIIVVFLSILPGIIAYLRKRLRPRPSQIDERRKDLVEVQTSTEG